MRKWEIFPKHPFSTVFRNCSPIFFKILRGFLITFQIFSDFWITLWHFVKQKMSISEISPKLLFFKFFRNLSKDFLSFFDFLKIVVSSVLLHSNEIKAIRGKYQVVYIIFQISSFSDFLIIYGSQINNH